MSTYSNETYSAILAACAGQCVGRCAENRGKSGVQCTVGAGYELEKIYIQMDFIGEQAHASQAHASTADYEHLKLIAADRGLTPEGG